MLILHSENIVEQYENFKNEINMKEEMKKLVGDVCRISIPTMITLSFSGLYSVIDGMFISHAAGATGLAAINIAWPIPAVITALGLGIGTGGAVLYSHEKGCSNNRYAGEIWKITIGLLVLCAVVITTVLGSTYKEILALLGAKEEVLMQAEQYCFIIICGSIVQVFGAGIIPLMRNISMAIHSMAASVCGMFVNLFANYFLIVHHGMGIRGAAFGTVIAQITVSFLSIGLIVLTAKKRGVKAEKYYLTKEDIYRTIKKIFMTAVPVFGMSIAPTIVLMITNWQCLVYGGEVVVAAYAVISYVVFPVQALLQGIGDGIQPLMSFYFGAKDRYKILAIKKIAIIMILLTEIIFFFGTWLLRKQIAMLFHVTGQSLPVFMEGYGISIFSFFFYGFHKFNISYQNACMNVKKAMFLSYGETLIVAPLLLFGLPKLMGRIGIWVSLPVTGIVMLLIYAKGWKRNEM